MFNIITQIVIILIIFLCAMGSEDCDGDGGEDCVEVPVGQCIIFVDEDGEDIDD